MQLLLAWRLPTPEVARGARRRLAGVRAQRGPGRARARGRRRARAGRVAAALERHGDEAEPLRGALREEADDRNLLIALRLRGGPTAGAGRTPRGAHFPSRGRASRARRCRGAAGAPPRPRGRRGGRSSRCPAAERWGVPLARWVASGDVVALQDDLEVARARRARVGLFDDRRPARHRHPARLRQQPRRRRRATCACVGRGRRARGRRGPACARGWCCRERARHGRRPAAPAGRPDDAPSSRPATGWPASPRWRPAPGRRPPSACASSSTAASRGSSRCTSRSCASSSRAGGARSRSRWTPIVVALPAGEARVGASERRERLLRLLRQTVGYQITFEPGERQ